MGCLIFCCSYQILVERIPEPGIKEILVGEIRKAFTMKGVHELLKRQSVIQNGNITLTSTFPDKRMRSSGGCKQNNGRERLHRETVHNQKKRGYLASMESSMYPRKDCGREKC
jgi:hypothetical protein